MLRLDDLASDLDLEALFGVPDLTGRLAPFPVPGPDDGPLLRAGLFEQQLPAGVERVAGPPLKRKGRHERATWLQVITEAAQRARRGARVGYELQHARGAQDRSVAAGELKLLHPLLVKGGGGQALPLCLGAADRQHLARVIDAVNVYALCEVVQEKAASAAADVQHRLSVLADDVQEEKPVAPARSVITPHVPGGRQQTVIVVAGPGHGHPPRGSASRETRAAARISRKSSPTTAHDFPGARLPAA